MPLAASWLSGGVQGLVPPGYAGGFRFPAPVRFGMSLLAKVMTKSTYRI